MERSGQKRRRSAGFAVMGKHHMSKAGRRMPCLTEIENMRLSCKFRHLRLLVLPFGYFCGKLVFLSQIQSWARYTNAGPERLRILHIQPGRYKSDTRFYMSRVGPWMHESCSPISENKRTEQGYLRGISRKWRAGADFVRIMRWFSWFSVRRSGPLFQSKYEAKNTGALELEHRDCKFRAFWNIARQTWIRIMAVFKERAEVENSKRTLSPNFPRPSNFAFPYISGPPGSCFKLHRWHCKVLDRIRTYRRLRGDKYKQTR